MFASCCGNTASTQTPKAQRSHEILPSLLGCRSSILRTSISPSRGGRREHTKDLWEVCQEAKIMLGRREAFPIVDLEVLRRSYSGCRPDKMNGNYVVVGRTREGLFASYVGMTARSSVNPSFFSR